MQNFIERKEYLENLIKLREVDVIKVITGVRRCGKSTLFDLYIDYLKGTGVQDEQIIVVNLEKVQFEDLKNYKTLHEYIYTRLCKDKYTYVFVDEVQMCEHFEKAIDSLYTEKNIDVYITGSNANMLSRRTCNPNFWKICRNKNVAIIFCRIYTCFSRIRYSR